MLVNNVFSPFLYSFHLEHDIILPLWIGNINLVNITITKVTVSEAEIIFWTIVSSIVKANVWLDMLTGFFLGGDGGDQFYLFCLSFRLNLGDNVTEKQSVTGIGRDWERLRKRNWKPNPNKEAMDETSPVEK